jgi:hypothetical protein
MNQHEHEGPGIIELPTTRRTTRKLSDQEEAIHGPDPAAPDASARGVAMVVYQPARGYSRRPNHGANASSVSCKGRVAKAHEE